MLEEEKTDSESSCLLFEKKKSGYPKRMKIVVGLSVFIAVYRYLLIILDPSRVGLRCKAQDDGLAIAGQEQNDKKGSMKLLGIPLRKTGENEGKPQKTYKYNSKNFVSVDFPCVL